MVRSKIFAVKKLGFNLRISIDRGSEIYVSEGEKVVKGQKLYTVHKSIIKESFYLPEILKIDINRAREYIGRVGGEYVSVGDILAEKVSTIGINTRRIYASKEGIISLKRIEKGFLDILDEADQVDVKSTHTGTIKNIIPDSEIVLETGGAQLQTFYSNLDEEIKGELHILSDFDETISPNRVKPKEVFDKVVYAGKFFNDQLTHALYENGAKLVMFYSANFFDINNLPEDIVILNGFGQLSASKRYFDFLRSYDGGQLVVNNSEITVLDADGIKLEEFKGYKYFVEKINNGDTVEILQSDRYGAMAEIVDTDDSVFVDENIVKLKVGSNQNVILDEESVKLLYK